MEKYYIDQYKKLYEIKKGYGATSIKLYNYIMPIIKKYNPKSILDYGCGKSKLIDNINNDMGIKIYKYDPAIEEYNKLPKDNIDFIICTDVLQHIPIWDLDRVLLEIKNINNKCFFYIKCTQYTTTLPNGKPANCTVYPFEWWKKKLKEYFKEVNEVQIDDVTTATFITK